MKTAEISPPNPIVADSPVNFKMANFVARIIRIPLSHLVAEQAGRDLSCGKFADVSSFLRGDQTRQRGTSKQPFSGPKAKQIQVTAMRVAASSRS